ncbi:hypothetical protein DFH11DRAFT_1543814 [Phellopilus nigrolimitatus]|nr:hypothetical protein DFH11DRAFT_1543814 [Phellopilus nigrolimitatus]
MAPAYTLRTNKKQINKDDATIELVIPTDFCMTENVAKVNMLDLDKYRAKLKPGRHKKISTGKPGRFRLLLTADQAKKVQETQVEKQEKIAAECKQILESGTE